MRKRKHFRSQKEQEDLMLIFDAKVLDVLELNTVYESQIRLKSVFMCESATGNPRMCVYWGNRIGLEIGDRVNMKGRIKNNVFLPKSVQVIKEQKN